MMGRKKNVQDEKMMILYGSSSHEKEVDAKLLDCTLVFRREKNIHISIPKIQTNFFLIKIKTLPDLKVFILILGSVTVSPASLVA